MRARDLMSSRVLSCHVNDPLTVAAQRMWDGDVGAQEWAEVEREMRPEWVKKHRAEVHRLHSALRRARVDTWPLDQLEQAVTRGREAQKAINDAIKLLTGTP